MSAHEQSQSFSGSELLRDQKRVLICQASVGAGHRRAAEAIEAALRIEYPHIEVKSVDVMTFADRVFAYFYKDVYLQFASGQSFTGSLGNVLLGFLFDKSNVIQKGQLTGGGWLNRRLTMTMILNFLEYLCDYEPDIIIHTHFLASEIIAGLRRHNGYTVPQVTIITDMDVHAWWYQQPCEKYFVPRALCQYQLELHGVPAEDIQVSGIPILPCFEDLVKNVSELGPEDRRQRFLDFMDIKLDLWESAEDLRPVLLVMSGGSGVFPTFENLLQLRTPSIIVVVCGRQADIRSELEKIHVPKHLRVRFAGYTHTMHELMAVGDVIITKPGGLITSEALTCGLMIVIVDPYAGQEERNAAMLLEEGAAIQVHNPEVTSFRLDPILKEPALLTRYRQNSRRLARPDAARRIVRCVVRETLGEADCNDDHDTGLRPSTSSVVSHAQRERSTSDLCSNPHLSTRERSESNFSASPLSWFEQAHGARYPRSPHMAPSLPRSLPRIPSHGDMERQLPMLDEI